MSDEQRAEQVRSALISKYGPQVYWLASAITVVGLTVGHLRATKADEDLTAAVVRYSSELVVEICHGYGVSTSVVYDCVEEIKLMVHKHDQSTVLPADNHTH